MLLGFNFNPIILCVRLGTFGISVDYRCLFTRLRLLYLLADLPPNIVKLRFLTL